MVLLDPGHSTENMFFQAGEGVAGVVGVALIERWNNAPVHFSRDEAPGWVVWVEGRRDMVVFRSHFDVFYVNR